jgi:uroporphyrinogen-III decarboxylase
LDEPGTPVKVVEPYQMLGEIKPDLINALGVDVVPLTSTTTLFGYKGENWKSWTTFQGTPVLVPEKFNTDPEPDGSLHMYPQGDKSAPPSCKMPEGGWYFDAIIRQPALNDQKLTIEDNLEEFEVFSENDIRWYAEEAERLYAETDKAIFLSFMSISIGTISLILAPSLIHPKGIRDVEEWWISTTTRRDHVYRIFEHQCEIALENLAKVHQAVGERVSVIMTSTTDFGMQTGLFISPRTYRNLYKPFHQQINNWVHENTSWKTFMHSCGSVWRLIDDFIEAGFDILSPVQTSAADMDPHRLKQTFGDKMVFWGGGVDTQKTLPFGTPDEVRSEVKERIAALGPGGGFVFNTIHNVQPQTPIENLLAMYNTLNDHGTYPIKWQPDAVD